MVLWVLLISLFYTMSQTGGNQILYIGNSIESIDGITISSYCIFSKRYHQLHMYQMLLLH